VRERSDEDLLVAVAAGPGALPEFYRRHVAKVIGMGVRRFGNPEDVADFVATVFLEVLGSAGRFDPRRGGAVSWLYGLADNVAAGMCRQQARLAEAERRLAGRMLLDADDYARVEERNRYHPAARRPVSVESGTRHAGTASNQTRPGEGQ
jgi:RNA polymerase sigma-70 factor, ECF subfamily